MPTFIERIRGLLEQEEAKKQRQIEESREEEKKSKERLELSLRLNKEAIELIKPEQILNELNIHLLNGKGRIVKEEGVLIHDYFQEYRDGGGKYVPCTHALSSVSLLWERSSQGRKTVFHKLMIAVGRVEPVEFKGNEKREGGIFWNINNRGYPDAAEIHYHRGPDARIDIQNLEDDREKLEIIRQQIKSSICLILEKLMEEKYTKLDAEEIFPLR